MKAEDIKTPGDLEKWLLARPDPKADAIAISRRIAMREFPLFAAWSDPYLVGTGASKILPQVRVFLITRIADTMPTHVIKAAAATADADAQNASDALLAALTDTAAIAYAYAATHADTSAVVRFAAHAALTDSSAGASAAARANASATAGAAAQADAVLLEGEKLLHDAQLWQADVPDWFKEKEAAMFALWDEAPAARWQFWRRFWQAEVQGTPLPRPLLEEIAKTLTEDDWSDPDLCAAAIARIEERFDLAEQARKQAEEIEALRQQLAAYERRSHNQPPELVDTEFSPSKDVLVLSEAFRVVEKELGNPAPDAEVLQEQAEVIEEKSHYLLMLCHKFAVKFAEKLGEETAKLIGRGALVAIATASLTYSKTLMDYVAKLFAGM